MIIDKKPNYIDWPSKSAQEVRKAANLLVSCGGDGDSNYRNCNDDFDLTFHGVSPSYWPRPGCLGQGSI